MRALKTLVMVIAALGIVESAGCGGAGGGPTTFQCVNASQCNLMAGGICAALSYCAYPDSQCPSGYRYSTSSGTVSGQCVPGSQSDAGPPFGNGLGVSGVGGAAMTSPHFVLHNAAGQSTPLGAGHPTSSTFVYTPGNLGGK
jgi:hypothetical protein